jgi:hypothetical protein
VDVEDDVAVVLVPQAASASKKNMQAGYVTVRTAAERKRSAERPVTLAPGSWVGCCGFVFLSCNRQT